MIIMITQEHEYYIRFILLLIQGGTELLREIAAKALQKCNTPLNIFLSMNASVIQRGLSKKQKDILYPSSPTVVSDLKDYDIAILSYLLTNFLTANLDSNERNAVDNIKTMWSVYHAHTNEAKMTAITFTKEWNKLMRTIMIASFNLPKEKRDSLCKIADSIENEQLDIKVVIDEIKKLDQTNIFFEYIKKSIDDLNQNIDARLSKFEKDILEKKWKMENQGKKTKVVHTARGQVTLSANEQETVDYAAEKLEATKDYVEKCLTDHNKQLEQKVDKLIEDVQKLDMKVEKIGQRTAAMLTVEHEYYIRFILLLLQAGSDLLREITKKALAKKNETLPQFLSSARDAIRNDKTLTKIQNDTLYPSTPQGPSFEDFDITLMSHLLKTYLKQYIEINETNAVSDIQEMRNNDYAHVKKDDEMDTATSIRGEWNKLTTIIKYVTTGMTPDVQKKHRDMIEHIEKDPLDTTVALEEIKKRDQSRDFFEKIQQSLESIQNDQREIIKSQQELRKSQEVIDVHQKEINKGQSGIIKGQEQLSIKVDNLNTMVRNTAVAVAGIDTSSGCVPESPLTELSINVTDEGDLPHPDVFKHVSKRIRYSDSFKDQCRSVCQYIQGTSKEIKTVWPAYKYSKHETPEEYTNIVFIVITNNGEENLTAFNYNIYQRAENMCINNESEFINKQEFDLEVSDQDLEQIEHIENCITQHSDELIKSYRKLTMIIPSFFKSKKFGSQDAEIQPLPCLVFYTQIKGFIPLSEEPFPEEIDGFPVDVREDTFTFSHDGPSDYHQSIKMGCEIGSDKLNAEQNPLRGTLGGFVEDNVHGPCCFTCAHVIFPDLSNLPRVKPDTLIWIEDGERISVFQPSLVTDKFGVAFGRVVKAVFDGVAGVDAALIKIEKREPTSGEFPHSPSETIFSHEEPMIYGTGKICHRSNLKRNRVVYKFGASTNITQGVLQVNRGVVVSQIPEIREHEVSDIKFSLRDQLFIYKVDESAFSAPGDSGALVFVEEDDKILIAIGMVEGTTFSQRSVATPIHKIIKALDLKTQELKRF